MLEFYLQVSNLCLSMSESLTNVSACRCMTHGFAVIMGSVFGHAWTANIIKQCQRLVSCTKQGHEMQAWVHAEYNSMKAEPEHKDVTWLVQAAATQHTIACTQCSGWNQHFTLYSLSIVLSRAKGLPSSKKL